MTLLLKVEIDELVKASQDNLQPAANEESLKEQAKEVKFLSHLAAFINWNLQWCCYWYLWQMKTKKKLDFYDQSWDKLDHVGVTATIGPSNQLVLNEISDLSGESVIRAVYQQLTKVILATVNLSFAEGFQFESLFVHKPSVDGSPENNIASVSKFIFPLNSSLLVHLPDSGSERNMSQSRELLTVASRLNVDGQLLKLIDLKRQWHYKAKIAVMRQARQSGKQVAKSLDVNKSVLDEYCVYVLSFVLPQDPPAFNKTYQLSSGLLLNEVISIVKKTGLDALDSHLLECLLCQTFYLSCFISEDSAEKSLVEKLCYMLVSAVGFKSWQDILKRQAATSNTITKVDNDEAAEFLCRVE